MSEVKSLFVPEGLEGERVDAVPAVTGALDDAGVGEAVQQSTGAQRVGADQGGEFVEGASCGVDSCVEVPG